MGFSLAEFGMIILVSHKFLWCKLAPDFVLSIWVISPVSEFKFEKKKSNLIVLKVRIVFDQ